MAHDSSIEKITAEVVESLVVTACSMGERVLTQCSLVNQSQTQQSSKTQNSKCYDSFAVFTAKSNKKTIAQSAENDVTIMEDLTPSPFGPLVEFLPDSEINLVNRQNVRNLNRPSQFPKNPDPFDECSLMIKQLLDTFDTDFDKKDSVQSFPLQDKQERVSSFIEANQAHSTIHCSETGMSDLFSLPFGNTDHCIDTKVAKHQRGSDCESTLDLACVRSIENDSDFGNLEADIDHMVEKIISNNVDMLLCCQPKKSKSRSRSALEILQLPPCNQKHKTPSTPECSNNLAALKLHSNGRTSPAEMRKNDENTIPLGWISTSAKRKQKAPTFTRTRSRSDDFAYCGPLRETSTSNDEDEEIKTCSTCFKLRHPEQACEISTELLCSGVAIAPGVCDKAGNSLVYVIADDILWRRSAVGVISLSRLLLYLINRFDKISLVLDCKNSNVTNMKTLLEAFNVVLNNKRIKVEHILLLSPTENDEYSSLQSVLKSLFECECTKLLSTTELAIYVDSTALMKCYDGQLQFSQADWAQNRLVVDSFVAFCDNVRRNFSRETTSMTSQSFPQTAKETQALLKQHQQEMKSLLDDRQVTNLHDRSRRILEQLSNDDSVDSKSCAHLVQRNYAEARDAITQFVRVADDRLIALEHHLLVKQFEESCEYIHNWYTSNMKILTELFPRVPETIEDLRKQRAEFDAFYIDAMSEYTKCDCMLNEVEQLNDLGYFCDTELTRRAKLTEEEVKELVFKMENKKDEVEVATQMYQFIDKAYAWALEGMKFVALLNMNECKNSESCQKLLNQFDDYMKYHPVIPESAFNEIQELCRRYGNVKCLKQCDYAKQKCKETSELFYKRRELIAKLKTQFKSSSKKRLSFRLKSREKSETIAHDRIPTSPAFSTTSRTTTLPDEESVDNMSLLSYESSGIDEMSVHTMSPSPSNGFLPFGELNHTPKMNSTPKINPRPARKMLKKSESLPSKYMVEHQIGNHAHSKSGVPLTIGSPVLEEEVDNRGKNQVILIIEELISTEKEYVKSLNYVIEHYFPEMCKLDIPQALRCKRNVIFGNIEKISEFHSGYFLRDLENCDGNPFKVAKTFQSHKDSFGLYALYSKNKPQSDQLLQEHGIEFFKTKQIELGDKMDLASYLLKPVQRMGKYALLLHAMSKKCKSEDERSLREAEDLVKFQLRHGNDLLTMDSIRDCDVNLKEQGNLLRQEQFIIFSGRRKIVRRVFLFEELILFSKPIIVHGGHDVYQYKGSYKTAEIGMTENIGDSGFKFEVWFRRRRPHQSPQDTYVFQSVNRAIKRAWVDEIRNLLWKQALQNKDYRRKEMTSMGVGSKPHLDLALSSENRITDRSVVATPPGDRSFLSQKLPRGRTRVSIAVPSFDYMALQNKRPHSTISTSSSTSSVGSGNNQSSSLVSSLALASYSIRNDVKPITGFSPPMAYCDFHAIAEDQNEDCESVSESESSVTTSHEETPDVTCKSPGLSRPYVNTSHEKVSAVTCESSDISRQYVNTSCEEVSDVPCKSDLSRPYVDTSHVEVPDVACKSPGISRPYANTSREEVPDVACKSPGLSTQYVTTV